MTINWNLIASLSSLISLIITSIALIIAFLTYKREFSTRLTFEHKIGFCLNTATNKPVYGIEMNVSNVGNRSVTVTEVSLKICDQNLMLFPEKMKLDSGETGCFNFAPAEGQVRYFISDDKKLLRKKLMYEVKTPVRKYKIKCDMTCSDFFTDFFKVLQKINTANGEKENHNSIDDDERPPPAVSFPLPKTNESR